jgi:putative ABC transport system permease protein
MPALAKLAFRNLFAHRAKTLIVGSIVALGVLVLMAGISFMDTASLGLRRSFIDNFTADVMISGKPEEGESISLFGAMSMGGTATTPVLPRLEEVMSYLNGRPGVRCLTTQLTGANQINIEGNDSANVESLLYLFGIEPWDYRAMFDNLDIVQGRYLLPGEQGIMLSTGQVESLGKELKTRIKVGDALILQDFGTAVRAVNLRGIYEYKHGNAALDVICYVDANTLRALQAIRTDLPEAVGRPGIDRSLLAPEDELFGGKGNVVEAPPAAVPGVEQGAPARPRAPSPSEVGVEPLDGRRASRAGSPRPRVQQWHFILVSLKDHSAAPGFVEETNRWLSGRGIDAVAVGWQKAAGPFGLIPGVIRLLFAAAVLVVFVVAVIIIMNTLTASVIERTAEIGTMRALGARKGFIWRMFLIETLAVCAAFGLLGILAGSALIAALNAAGVPASNTILKLLVGGPVIRPVISTSALGVSVLVFLVIGVVSHLYPVAVALRITPMRAILAGQNE